MSERRAEVLHRSARTRADTPAPVVALSPPDAGDAGPAPLSPPSLTPTAVPAAAEVPGAAALSAAVVAAASAVVVAAAAAAAVAAVAAAAAVAVASVHALHAWTRAPGDGAGVVRPMPGIGC